MCDHDTLHSAHHNKTISMTDIVVQYRDTEITLNNITMHCQTHKAWFMRDTNIQMIHSILHTIGNHHTNHTTQHTNIHNNMTHSPQTRPPNGPSDINNRCHMKTTLSNEQCQNDDLRTTILGVNNSIASLLG